jgi:copper chaperone NosL
MKIKYSINIIFCLALATFISCSAQPEPINYGHDECSYCKMTIVDKAHSAQMVTKKGKQYKFDAIECMARNVHEDHKLAEKSNLLVADYINPGTMLNAEKATYIISPKIKSPMGANLSAVADVKTAKKIIKEKGGEIYTWKPLIKVLTED